MGSRAWALQRVFGEFSTRGSMGMWKAAPVALPGWFSGLPERAERVPADGTSAGPQPQEPPKGH